MTFEEDLAYANKILRVRTILEQQTYTSNPRFRHFSLRPDVFEYHMKRGYGDEIVIGYHEKRQEAKHINFYSWETLIYNNTKLDRMQVPYVRGMNRYQVNELCEEWHFQQSLVCDPDVLTGMVVFNVLDSVQTDFDYFQLKVRHLDDIIRRYELE